ncbi:MAG: hypothetical protein DKM50_10020 [Candidatus Margulisiibacteriota bacterium]|nr:MAG: hypothetical protein A2X43_04105 [Candidatus Margulisbacteria bacterium GWD2_39_127]OGI05184.1 MAG: hypothetical protein A2X42_02615 [Candidatus Margulisbacteria bacterium GWF2_38_17]OGI06233.1 MAG: hypothetical protein A2X41_08195 [Candidatus Margulisbacteria bacterium GWE2_39_32]PZM78889.1 MAG: hypothetical protein DKM50_10020 [Candidatus Margulisiibacteriota bacterium]HAR64529.1 hypothetical protein [Candidatus Margulisiibacteriota bacterium]
MILKNYYTLKDTREITGCTHRQLQYWEKKGYISPKLGSRNVRYYRKEDIESIKQLIEAKNSGKTLGEAWGENKLSITVKNPLIFSLDHQTLNKINQLTTEWMAANNLLIEQLLGTSELEKNTPGYPFSLYKSEHIETLKQNIETIKKTIKKREKIDDCLKLFLKDIQPGKKIELTPEESNINTLDALILYWAKAKKGSYNKNELLQIRESFSDRLRRGEAFCDIIMAIKMIEAVS